MNENTKHFLELVNANSDLPIVPMVNYDVVAEDNGYWMGGFGISEVAEYALYNDRVYTDRDNFKTDYYDYNQDELNEQFNYNPEINEYTVKCGRYTQEQLAENNRHDKEIDAYLEKVADELFIDAIIVYITTP